LVRVGKAQRDLHNGKLENVWKKDDLNFKQGQRSIGRDNGLMLFVLRRLMVTAAGLTLRWNRDVVID
jgi:hypothetical protein